MSEPHSLDRPVVVTPTSWRDRALAGLHRALLRALIKPVFSPRWSIRFQRAWLETLARTTAPVPRSVTVSTGEAGGVPGEWFQPRSDEAPAGTVLYLHGGAYCIGSAATHRALTGRLARASGLPVFSANYRLAPEHPHPAALQDALAAFRALAARGPVVIGGDSAGGGLALATALALRDAGGPQPAALLLLSPWADQVIPDPLPPPVPGEAMLSPAWAEACSAHYRGATPADDPAISPIRADLRGLPPTLIQAGTDELLHDQALDLHRALRAAGVTARCDITRGRWHVFQLQAGLLPSADDAITRLASFTHAHLPGDPEVLILGAGMSGLCAALALQRAGRHRFVIVEKQDGLGGTWWDNRYPGAHVDVPAPVYSFSFAPNPGWTRRFAAAPEIQRYQQALAERFGLLDRIRFHTRLTEARFDETDHRWHVRAEASPDAQAPGSDPTSATLRARFFVCSTGPLNQPRWPDIPGLDTFTGQRLHSARWDASVPLQGRRVAVIGTGSTASQLVGPIAQQAARLHVFQRTANWVLPRLDRRYTALDRWLAHWPPYARFTRWAWMQVLEWGRRGFDDGTLARRGMLRTAALHRQRQIPDPALRERLVPPYPLGCKRIIYSNDFYPALARPNVELVTEPIAAITPTGIRTADGAERPIDVLVCATGFDTQQPLSSLTITGRGGQRLRDAWADGPQAHHGISVAGFPNLFLLLGPNTGTGHTSTLLYIEPEVQHTLACMVAVRAGGHRHIEVRDEAMRAHNAALQARLDGSVWSHCRSWYRHDSGRITALFPGFTAEYVRAVARPRWEDYRFG